MRVVYLETNNVESIGCPSIYITAARDVAVGLNHKNDLLIFDNEHATVLGAFTQRQVDDLCSYLQRLKIHLPA